jgi:hypothetical protein
VVVTSEPPGAEVSLDGERTGQVTPAVLEGVWLSKPHQVSLVAPDAKSVTLPVRGKPGQLVARVHARLVNAVGNVTVESDPAGALVRFDDRPVGRAPVTIREVRLDERHRVDLALEGHEIDQFVVLPEKDGTRFRRRLTAKP